MSVSVLIPVKDPAPYLKKVIERIEEIRDRRPGLICEILTEREGSLSEARRAMVARAHGFYVLNLDQDNLIPRDYIEEAQSVFFRCDRVGAVALPYSLQVNAHLGFGTSIIPLDLMRRFYTWRNRKRDKDCECIFMWRALHNGGYIVATLPMKARRLEKKPGWQT